MVEYTVLRDYQTAVGLLLAATPERSARYYRDALCTLALAVSWRLVFECTRSRFAALRVLSHGWCACWHLRQVLRPPGLRARGCRVEVCRVWCTSTWTRCARWPFQCALAGFQLATALLPPGMA